MFYKFLVRGTKKLIRGSRITNPQLQLWNNLFFHLSLRYLKRFEAPLIKPFEVPQRSEKIEIWLNFYFDNFLKRSAWNFTPAWVSFRILVTILLIRCCHRNCTTAMVKSTVTALNRRIYYGNFVLLLVSWIRWFWS